MADVETFELDIKTDDDTKTNTANTAVVSEIILDLDEAADLKKNAVHKEAMGGTELQLAALKRRLDPELYEQFNFIMSRVRDEFISADKPNILWLQDLPEDPESEHLKNPESRARFAKIVFNSYWQQLQYYTKLGVPYEDGIVIKNATEVFQPHTKPAGRTNLIYFSTPHRGLNILESAVRYLETQRDDFHLDVYSSFAIYGWEGRDEAFKPLYDKLCELDSVTYHGTVSHDEIREALYRAHILAYPNTWVESSCCVAFESMAAGLLAIMPNLGALTETGTDFAWLYNYESDPSHHASKFAQMLSHGIDQHRSPAIQNVLNLQTSYYNYFFSWNMRVAQWEDALRGILLEQKQVKKNG